MIFLSQTNFKENQRQKGNGLELLTVLKKECLKVVFFDPQYRGVLDKLSYGNEGVSRGKARSALPQMDQETIDKFLISIEQVLKPSGYLFLWVDKFHLIEGVKPWLIHTPNLCFVDMITWDKGKIGMGYRTRRKSEYLLIIQKKPTLAKATWTDHSIPDVWTEKIIKKVHPHLKPFELQKALIKATTQEGDFVCDPAAGGYSIFECCKALNRNFIGCDLIFGENNK